MAQARRRSPAKPKRKRTGNGLFSIVMLFAGMLIGSLATILWQGTRTADGGVGSGIRQMIESSRQQSTAEEANQVGLEAAQPAKRSTNYDFFTVLPEIEVVVSATEEPEAKVAAKPPKPESPAVSGNSSYMLQAGSYQSESDAERLKATLALQGMASKIQKVSIQGRGDFFRVRLGPYPSHRAMAKADEQLSRAGIKALRLKISSSG